MTKVNSITAAYLDTSFYHPVRDPVWGSIMLSDGFKSLVSSPVLQKMNRIRQLGPTYLVYPGAVHTRFIHSLGVYHIGYRMIRRLLTFDSCPTVTVQDVNAFLAACLLHDLGHFPYTHSLKELPLKKHEALTGEYILAEPLASLIKDALEIDPAIPAAIVDTTMESTDAEPVIDAPTARNFVWALQAVDNGIYAICQDPDLGGLVETSSNIASVHTAENEITALASQRSNVMSNLDNMCATIAATFQLAGAEVKHSDGYPAWKMRTESHLRDTVVACYKELFGKEPIVRGIHAGLECGLFSERYPQLDMISFGPTLRGVHSPDECLHIPTVQMVWNHLLLVLKRI